MIKIALSTTSASGFTQVRYVTLDWWFSKKPKNWLSPLMCNSQGIIKLVLIKVLEKG
jgi:hypothetical protein